MHLLVGFLASSPPPDRGHFPEKPFEGQVREGFLRKSVLYRENGSLGRDSSTEKVFLRKSVLYRETGP